MSSKNMKNVLVAVLLLWAICATLFATTVYKRTAYTHCTNDQWRNLARSISAVEERKELSAMKERSSQTSSPDTRESIESVDHKEATNVYSRVDQLKPNPNGSLIRSGDDHGLQKYVSRIFHPAKHEDNEEFTMIMLTYKRVNMLSKLIKHYCGAKRLHKLLVIWNDVDSAIPQHILDLTHSCQTRLEFIQEKENKLTNRFKPRPEIETECVCIIDDDRLIDDITDLEGAFHAWQSFRERIIGYEMRSYTFQKDGSLFYGQYDQAKPYPGYAMMGTGTAILHKAYLEMFFDPEVMPKAMFDYVNDGRNCEDLAMNVIATKFLEDVSWHQPAALSYKHKGQIKNMEALAYEPGGHRGLSMRPDHYRKRTECLNKFAEFYSGQLPLHYTFLRVFYDEAMS